MRIGIDGGCLSNKRGFGRFAREIVAALAEVPSPHEFVVVLDRPSSDDVTIPSRFEQVVVPVREAPSVAASAKSRRRFGDMLAMGKAAARAGLDLIYFPASYSYFPVWNVPSVVVTMHDTLALAHPELVFPTWKGRIAWTLKERAAAHRADAIVTGSEASRRDLIAWFHLPPDRVTVLSEGPDAAFVPRPTGADARAVLARHGLRVGERFLLYVGGLSPHKNLPRLIEAFGRLEPSDVPLLLVGDTGDVFHTHVPTIREAIATNGLEGKVRFAGYVPDADLVHLYNAAYALVQPSILEGFGLPPLEAMACGTPVLYSRAGSLPEVVGDAGIDFDPGDIPSMTYALKTLLADPDERERLSVRALARSKRFSWKLGARTLIDCFDRLGSDRVRGKSA